MSFLIKEIKAMKRLVCLMLCGMLMLLFAGCGKKEADKKYTTDTDVEYYVRQGRIPECGQYSLGDSAEKIKSELDKQMNAEDGSEEEHSHDEDEFFYFVEEKTEFCGLRTGSAEYCYKPTEDEISAIVSFGDALGFKAGDISIEIEEAMTDKYGAARHSSSAEGLPFLPSDSGTEYITYTFAGRTVTFAFYENALCATAVYDVKNWSLR